MFRFIHFCLHIFLFTYILPLFVIIKYIFTFRSNPNLFDMISNSYMKIMKLKFQQINSDNKLEEMTKTIILTNHTSFADFFIDPFLFKCPVIARGMAILVSGLFGISSLFFDRTIMINRFKDNRNSIFEKVKNKNRFFFYPEGTRCSHKELPTDFLTKTILDKSDAKLGYLKPGLLKSLYEYSKDSNTNRCFQIIISPNKNKILNESKYLIGYNKTITYYVGEKINIINYNTFDDFFMAIKQEWSRCWSEAHKTI